MAEYKGKLLKGLFTRATKCLLSDGQTSVETALGTKTETITVPLDGTTDASGNYYTGVLKVSVPPMSGVLFDTDSTSYDGLYIPFISPVTGGLYLHVTNFSQVSQPSVTVKGNLHITRRI